MNGRIEDYALIGNTQTAALIDTTGSLDWLCLPRFDSTACFASLLGSAENGRWLISPSDKILKTVRRYRDETLILETEFETESGRITLIDFMPVAEQSGRIDLVRLVRGDRGPVMMRTEIVLRFDYGRVTPWVRGRPDGLVAVAGPSAVTIRTPVTLTGKNFTTAGQFEIHEGQTIPFILTWYPSHEREPPKRSPQRLLEETETRWRHWSSLCCAQGETRDLILRSLITLKALTFKQTGAIVAAPTTSLPEKIGGSRNWDYRYCWLRDATLTLYALLTSGYRTEAKAWREWLIRAVAGHPAETQIMYGIAGERLLPEFELPWLAGFNHSRPVRVGNAAHNQVQLDVFGEVVDTLYVAMKNGLTPDDNSWEVAKALVQFVEDSWQRPDHGIWEVRGRPRQFTHSKVMAWVALNRAIKAVEKFNLDGPCDRWRELSARIHTEVCHEGFNSKRNAFVQSYGSSELDASLLMMPLVGFLPADDPRMTATVRAIERELMQDGLVLRYQTGTGVDGLPVGEGAFLACSFWLADNYALSGRTQDAMRLFQQLLSMRNDVGLQEE
jgi:GH15 family glucan-1,4-alpha-glucosidase